MLIRTGLVLPVDLHNVCAEICSVIWAGSFTSQITGMVNSHRINNTDVPRDDYRLPEVTG